MTQSFHPAPALYIYLFCICPLLYSAFKKKNAFKKVIIEDRTGQVARWCIHKVLSLCRGKEDKSFWVNCKLNHELQKIIRDNWTYGSVKGKRKEWPKNRRNRLILWDSDKTVNNGGHSTSVMRLKLEFDFLKYNKLSCRTSKTAGRWTLTVNYWGNNSWN